MIQIRKKDGSVVKVESGEFVEIVNAADNSIGLMFMAVNATTVLQVSAGSEDAVRYAEMFKKFGVKFTPTIIDRAA